ncbi:hypothetical protein FEF09_28320 [Chitinophaga pinensis]|uniref:Uncharacterized protein n=1 Tax=Chitinophaga pinensis TaxID=79329 RepID=A0A5C6LLM5_9BACT|nr:hypothetical protein FEF09_28320 [Chitinophaga pinensis]
MFFKKEWELLKKGAVLQADHAAAGEPLLHLFIGGAYTGCLSFEATPQGIYMYRSGGNEIGVQEELLRIDNKGAVIEQWLYQRYCPGKFIMMHRPINYCWIWIITFMNMI